MQILFFSFIAVGIVILIFSIKLVRKTFYGDIILELPYLTKSSEFVLTKPGSYSIWHRGEFFRKAPLDQFRPEITSKSTGVKINLIPSLFRPNANNWKKARMELFRFTAPAGKYVLELTEGSCIIGAENRVIRLIPARMVDLDKYFIQIRESQPRISAFTGIFFMILGGLCIIFALVFGILADQMFAK